MIRTNLATRPFYNRRAVHVVVGLCVCVAVAVTLGNIVALRRAASTNTTLTVQTAQDEAAATERRNKAAALRASVDLAAVASAAGDAREANALIDQRIFSWSALFNQFEATLPDGVRLSSVHPAVDKDHRMHLSIAVVARNIEAVNTFMDRLDDTRAFVAVHATQDQLDDTGDVEAVVDAIYQPPPSATLDGASR